MVRGAFAVTGRKFDGIIRKQLEVTRDLDGFLATNSLSGIRATEGLTRCLKGMLELNPKARMSPAEII